MAQARGKTRKGATGKSPAKRRAAGRSGARDAISLLKADHRQVEQWFEQFEKARKDDRKVELASNICAALRAHTTIEEEIFYPAFIEATGEKDLHHEAKIEHEGAKRLIDEIEASGPEDDYYDSKVKVLSEMIKHHVKEEEQPGGMFAHARDSDMDLPALGEAMAARKAELTSATRGGRPRRNGQRLGVTRPITRHGSYEDMQTATRERREA